MATETLTIPLVDGKTKGSDFISGDKDDTQIVTFTDGGAISDVEISKFGKDSPTESGQGPGGDDEFHFDLSTFNDDFVITMKSLDAGDTFFFDKAASWQVLDNDDTFGPHDLSSYKYNGFEFEDEHTIYGIKYFGSDGQPHYLVINLTSSNGTGTAGISITCFASGTLIETPDGPKAIEMLEPGDMVTCSDGLNRAIQWKGKRDISQRELRLRPEFRPVRISRNALGKGLPTRDLLVSPQHRIVISGWQAELVTGSSEVLVPAIKLVNGSTISRAEPQVDLTYHHIMFDTHQIVLSEGLPSESFYPGEIAVSALDADARHELLTLFPELEDGPEAWGDLRLPCATAAEADALSPAA